MLIVILILSYEPSFASKMIVCTSIKKKIADLSQNYIKFKGAGNLLEA